MLSFKGSVVYKPVNLSYKSTNKSVCLFSGGLDACTTVTRHIDENLILLSIRGSADYPLDDEYGWNFHLKELTTLAKSFNKPLVTVNSNFYSFIDNWGSLHSLIKKSNENWWHGFQHGIGLISLAIPYAYTKRLNRIYIASSYDSSSETITCASHPTIDEKLKFANCQVIHDGFELSRQAKMTIIQDKWKEEGLKMHVCLKQYQTENCSKCEKCYRTILAILAEGGDPNLYGFKYKFGDEKRIITDLKHRIDVTYVNYYADIQKRIIQNKDNIKSMDLLSFAFFDIKKINTTFYKRARKILEKTWIHSLIMKLK